MRIRFSFDFKIHIIFRHFLIKLNRNYRRNRSRSAIQTATHQSIVSQDEPAAQSQERSAASTVSCKYCNKSYSKSSNLNAHIKSAHEGRRFLCNYPGCTMDFTVKASLERHIHQFHSQQDSEDEGNPNPIVECEYFVDGSKVVLSEKAKLKKIQRLERTIRELNARNAELQKLLTEKDNEIITLKRSTNTIQIQHQSSVVGSSAKTSNFTNEPGKSKSLRTKYPNSKYIS